MSSARFCSDEPLDETAWNTGVLFERKDPEPLLIKILLMLSC